MSSLGIDHTPGPWVVNGQAIETNYGSGDMIIAHVYDPDDNGPDEWTANARLIASAPDLAALLTTTTRERDALLAACENASASWQADIVPIWMHEIRYALALVKAARDE